MRLPACIIAVVLMFLGALTASLTYHVKTHWAGPIVGFGILSAGAQMGATLAMAYSLDCHKEVSLKIYDFTSWKSRTDSTIVIW
jgi:hypothetical protein